MWARPHRGRRGTTSWQCFTLNSEALLPVGSSEPPSSWVIDFKPRWPVRQWRIARQVWAKPSVQNVLWLVGYPSMTSRGCKAVRRNSSPECSDTTADAGVGLLLLGRPTTCHPPACVGSSENRTQSTSTQHNKIEHDIRFLPCPLVLTNCVSRCWGSLSEVAPWDTVSLELCDLMQKQPSGPMTPR